MTTKTTNQTSMDRREFLSTTAAVGGAMVLGFWLPPRSAVAQSSTASEPWYHDAMAPEINAWITIAPDDTVTIRVGQCEMGQGRLYELPDDRGGGTAVRLAEGTGGVCLG